MSVNIDGALSPFRRVLGDRAPSLQSPVNRARGPQSVGRRDIYEMAWFLDRRDSIHFFARDRRLAQKLCDCLHLLEVRAEDFDGGQNDPDLGRDF